VHALACTLVNSLGFVAIKPTKGMSECSARRQHHAAHCGPTEIRRFRLRDSLHQAYITLRDKGRAKTRIRYANQSYQHRRGRLNSSVPGWQLFALHMPGVHGCRADNVHGDCRATSARLMSTRPSVMGLGDVKSPRVIVAPPSLTLLSVVGAQAATLCCQKER
jgi:hypothetical protein